MALNRLQLPQAQMEKLSIKSKSRTRSLLQWGIIIILCLETCITCLEKHTMTFICFFFLYGILQNISEKILEKMKCCIIYVQLNYIFLGSIIKYCTCFYLLLSILHSSTHVFHIHFAHIYQNTSHKKDSAIQNILASNVKLPSRHQRFQLLHVLLSRQQNVVLAVGCLCTQHEKIAVGLRLQAAMHQVLPVVLASY